MFVRRQKRYEAVQYDGKNIDAVIDFVGSRHVTTYNSGLVNTAPVVVVHTPGGSPQLVTGDWIVRNCADDTDVSVFSARSFEANFVAEDAPAGQSATIAVDSIGGGIGVNES